MKRFSILNLKKNITPKNVLIVFAIMLAVYLIYKQYTDVVENFYAWPWTKEENAQYADINSKISVPQYAQEFTGYYIGESTYGGGRHNIIKIIIWQPGQNLKRDSRGLVYLLNTDTWQQTKIGTIVEMLTSGFMIVRFDNGNHSILKQGPVKWDNNQRYVSIIAQKYQSADEKLVTGDLLRSQEYGGENDASRYLNQQLYKIPDDDMKTVQQTKNKKLLEWMMENVVPDLEIDTIVNQFKNNLNKLGGDNSKEVRTNVWYLSLIPDSEKTNYSDEIKFNFVVNAKHLFPGRNPNKINSYRFQYLPLVRINDINYVSNNGNRRDLIIRYNMDDIKEKLGEKVFGSLYSIFALIEIINGDGSITKKYLGQVTSLNPETGGGGINYSSTGWKVYKITTDFISNTYIPLVSNEDDALVNENEETETETESFFSRLIR